VSIAKKINDSVQEPDEEGYSDLEVTEVAIHPVVL
jgi:hypothetical protein